ncbi:HNH endonuclease [Bacillus cereus]|uniref:HNH endonuclease n=1 Tax=Bacillus cereus TaxID=1396 RepID=UPI003D64A2A2
MLTKEIQSQEENVLNGFSCVVCGFNFEERYGQMGKDFTHVHHLKELSQIGEEYEINPIEDLRPVCPNCHSMLHKRKPAYSIEELKNLL